MKFQKKIGGRGGGSGWGGGVRMDVNEELKGENSKKIGGGGSGGSGWGSGWM